MKFLTGLIASTALATAAASAFAGGKVLDDQAVPASPAASAAQSEGLQQSAREYLAKQGLTVTTMKDGTSKFLSECKPGHDSLLLFRADKTIGGILTGGTDRKIELGGFICQDSTGKTPVHFVASTEYVKPPAKIKGP